MLITDLSSEQLLMLIIPALPNMWALKHAMYHNFPTSQEKYRWMMACVFIPCLGGIAYYFVGKKHASKEKIDIRARIETERAHAAEQRAEDAANAEKVPSEPLAALAEKEPKAAGVSAAGGDNHPSCGEWSFGCPGEEKDRRRE